MVFLARDAPTSYKPLRQHLPPLLCDHGRMRTSLIVAIVGEDKPGIVERVSNLVLAAGGNWEESRMARLSGKFAGILRLSVSSVNAERLTVDLVGLEALGLKVV